MKLSIVIPAYNEAEIIEKTLAYLHSCLTIENISHELIVVDDHCIDKTARRVESAKKNYGSIRLVKNTMRPGFGNAVRTGLEYAKGEAVCIVMADGSDDPNDVVAYYKTLCEQKVDCVFGSRFMKGSVVIGYPIHKLILNRLVNFVIRVLFSIRYNDVTNAFKMYRREVIDGTQPFLSQHFNLTVEIPLKAIVRGFSFSVVPISWKQRKFGFSKLRIREMGSRYLFIVCYCFIEKWLSRGDYHRSASSIRVVAEKSAEHQ